MVAAQAIGRDRKTIFRERDAPARQYDQLKRPLAIAEVSIPGEGHENVRGEKQRDGQNANHGCPPSLKAACAERGAERALLSKDRRRVKSGGRSKDARYRLITGAGDGAEAQVT